MNGTVVQRFCLILTACLALTTCSNDSGTPFPPTGIVVLRLNGTTGALDPTFGSGSGIVVIDPDAGQFDFANAVALQPNGQILSAGRMVSQGLNSIALVRQNANGTLDGTFGAGGIVRTPIVVSNVGLSTSASAIAVQGDGKILVAAISFNQGLLQTSITLARYNSDGTPDTGFGAAGTGIVTAALGPGQDSDTCGLALQADGKIVVAGASTVTLPVTPPATPTNGKIFLYRYDSGGVLDPSFGAGGTVTTDLLATPTSPAIALQADGKIVLAGGKGSFEGTSSPVDQVVVRYNTNGTLDTTFGATQAMPGVVVTDIGARANFGSALLVQPNGRIVVAGHAFVDFGADASDISLVRYNTDGTLDPTFGTGGIAVTDLGGFDNALSIALSGIQFIVAGNSGSRGISGVAVLRYNADGSLDGTFGTSGVVAPPLVGPSITASGSGVVVQPDGNIVVAGFD